MSGPVYDDPIAHPGGKPINGGRCYVCGRTTHIKDGYQYCDNCMAVQKLSPTPPPVCTVCGSHINPDYGTGPVCGACLAERKDSPLKDALDDIAGALVDTLMKKNTDYGDSYRRLRDEFGPDSFLIRLGDKYNRLIALRGKEALVSETTDDTIRDIAGYCLLEMVYRKEAEA